MTLRAMVIGGGIAGCSVAHALGAHGIEVHLFERHHQIADEASGNPHGLLTPYLSRGVSPHHQFFNAAYLYTQRLFDNLGFAPNSALFSRCGAVQLPSTPRLREYIDHASSKHSFLTEIPTQILSPQQTAERTALALTSPSLWVPDAGVIAPARICRAILDAAPRPIALHLNSEVHLLRRDGGTWRILTTSSSGSSSEEFEGEIVVLANAYASHEILMRSLHSSPLRLEPVKGQILITPSNHTTSTLACALCYDGYILPTQGGEHLVGASYRHGVSTVSPDEDAHGEILSRLSRWLPEHGLAIPPLSRARVSIRTSTHDRLPFIGEVSGEPGLFVSVGHGSKGFCSAPFGAHIIAHLVAGTPLSDEWHSVAELVSPTRHQRR